MKKFIFALLATLTMFAAHAEPLAATDSQVSPAVSAAFEKYQAEINDTLIKVQRYPSLARRGNMEGTVIVRVALENGKPSVAIVEEGTQAHHVLRQAAKAMAESAVAFTALPAELHNQTLSVRYPIVFKLTDA